MRHLLPIAERASGTLWYAPQRQTQVIDGSEVPSDLVSPHFNIHRCKLDRSTVDRFYFRLRLPIGPALGLPDAGVAYSPDFTVPSVRGAKRAITVHDLAWMIRPEFAPRGLRNFLNRVVPEQVDSASCVFTVSESSRTDLVNILGVDPSKVILAPNAADERFFEASSSDRPQLAPLNLPEEYLLMVGSLEPRKNHLGMLRALSQVPDCPPVVIAGGRGWADETIRQAISEAVARGGVQYTGYVSERLLPALYACSSGVISPSWYEGFGLPVLEALSAGVNVAASDIAAHLEIGGDFGLYFNPGSEEAIADGIIRLLNAPAPRGDQRIAQRAWAGRFRWEQSAAQVWNALKEIA